MKRRAAGAVALAALLAPATASAHGIVGRQDLPIPRWLFVWAASVVLVVSFVGLSMLWQKPLLENAKQKIVATLPVAVEVALGAIGVAVFGFVVYAGFAGSQVDVDNIAPTWIYVYFWVVIPVACSVFGDLWRAVSPWRAIGRAAGVVTKRFGGEDIAEPLEYPVWLGQWPAAIAILCFTWLELVYPNRTDPSILATVALVYMVIQLVGMTVYGVRRWTENADGFGVLFGLYARISPFHWEDRKLAIRKPLAGLAQIKAQPGTVALLVVAIGSTSFDGGSQGATWASVAPHIQDFFLDLGFNQVRALELTFTVGLLFMIGLVGLVFRVGVIGMRRVDGKRSASQLARLFVFTLVPISLAYVVAHYFSLIAYQGQDLWRLASDPLGDGSNLFGTAGRSIDYTVVGANGIWYVQVFALIVGHVAGLALAHDRALVLYRRAEQATRSQYWMLGVMVAFTCLGLWLLSAAAQ